METTLPPEHWQGACQVALDGGNIFIGGGRQVISGAWADLKTGIMVLIYYFEVNADFVKSIMIQRTYFTLSMDG